MPIPAFTIDGVLPPFVGPNGPGGRAEDMTPYAVSSVELVTTLGTTDHRKAILRGWLQHRAAVRRLGFSGFQWVDGSFVEHDPQREPADIDVVCFMHMPTFVDRAAANLWAQQNHDVLFNRPHIKATYLVDFFLQPLNARPETLVNVTRYWAGLFSHRRKDNIWKGMLQVDLGDVADDQAAAAMLGSGPAQSAAGGAP